MARKKSVEGEPTRSEIEILQVLWKHGSSSVRFVNEELNRHREVAYASTLKIMQLMYEKEMLKRDESNMVHLYTAVVQEKRTKQILLRRFVDSIFEGSSSELMLQLLDNKKASAEELQTLKALLKKLDK